MRSDVKADSIKRADTEPWLDRMVIDGCQRDAVEPVKVTVRFQHSFECRQAQRVVIEYRDGSQIILPFDS